MIIQSNIQAHAQKQCHDLVNALEGVKRACFALAPRPYGSQGQLHADLDKIQSMHDMHMARALAVLNDIEQTAVSLVNRPPINQANGGYFAQARMSSVVESEREQAQAALDSVTSARSQLKALSSEINQQYNLLWALVNYAPS